MFFVKKNLSLSQICLTIVICAHIAQLRVWFFERLLIIDTLWCYQKIRRLVSGWYLWEGFLLYLGFCSFLTGRSSQLVATKCPCIMRNRNVMYAGNALFLTGLLFMVGFERTLALFTRYMHALFENLMLLFQLGEIEFEGRYVSFLGLLW